MDRHSPILASLTAVTLNWTSPVVADPEKNGERELTTLLMSSPGSWLRTDVSIQPDLQTYPELGFPVEGEQMRHPLAVSVRGSLESYFKGKPSPLEEEEAEAGSEEMPMPGDTEEQPQPPTMGTIETSPDTTRLVVIGSAEFLNDFIFDLSSALSGDRYLNSLQFAQNAVDWCVEDLDLLTIRSRGTASRVLVPLTEGQQSFWEGLNYVLALLAVVGIAVLWRLRKRNERPMDLVPQVVPDDAEEARS
jgi:ABC-2 type transport system permease protein